MTGVVFVSLSILIDVSLNQPGNEYNNIMTNNSSTMKKFA